MRRRRFELRNYARDGARIVNALIVSELIHNAPLMLMLIFVWAWDGYGYGYGDEYGDGISAHEIRTRIIITCPSAARCVRRSAWGGIL